MTPESVQIIVAVLTVTGTALSAFVGILVANSKTIYRIGQLEKKVELHNNAVTRLTMLEVKCVNTESRLDKVEGKMP